MLESHRRGDSNEYPQSMFWAEIWKVSDFLSENFQVLVVKFSIYLKRHCFVMSDCAHAQTDLSPLAGMLYSGSFQYLRTFTILSDVIIQYSSPLLQLQIAEIMKWLFAAIFYDIILKHKSEKNTAGFWVQKKNKNINVTFDTYRNPARRNISVCTI